LGRLVGGQKQNYTSGVKTSCTTGPSRTYCKTEQKTPPVPGVRAVHPRHPRPRVFAETELRSGARIRARIGDGPPFSNLNLGPPWVRWYDDLSTPYASARQRCVSDLIEMYRLRTKQIFGGRYVTPLCRFSVPRYAATQIFVARAARAKEKIAVKSLHPRAPSPACPGQIATARKTISCLLVFGRDRTLFPAQHA
jgi:hypothetical protein